MMKKRYGMVALLLAVMMLLATQDCVFAAVHGWSVMKSPGTTDSDTLVKMPLYKGDITFTVTSLTGSCSYLIGQCESGETSY